MNYLISSQVITTGSHGYICSIIDSQGAEVCDVYENVFYVKNSSIAINKSLLKKVKNARFAKKAFISYAKCRKNIIGGVYRFKNAINSPYGQKRANEELKRLYVALDEKKGIEDFLKEFCSIDFYLDHPLKDALNSFPALLKQFVEINELEQYGVIGPDDEVKKEVENNRLIANGYKSVAPELSDFAEAAAPFLPTAKGVEIAPLCKTVTPSNVRTYEAQVGEKKHIRIGKSKTRDYVAIIGTIQNGIFYTRYRFGRLDLIGKGESGRMIDRINEGQYNNERVVLAVYPDAIPSK